MKLKKTNNHFLPILLTILLLFTSCTPQTSGKIEMEESDAKHTEAIQETTTPTPTAAPTPEPTATPVPKVEGISFNEETGEVILSNFGEKVFSNCSDYEIIGENKVSFYCEEQGGECVYDNGFFVGRYPEMELPRAGITPAQYPIFENKEAVLSYFIDQGDIVAKMIMEGRIRVPFNNDGKLVFSDELKEHATEVFSKFDPVDVATAENIARFQIKFMNKEATELNPIRLNIPYDDMPFSTFNYNNQNLSKISVMDESEGEVDSRKVLPMLKGITMVMGLGALYEGEITPETQSKFTKYMDQFSEIAAAMETFNFNYTQETFDEVVRLTENNNCPIAIVALASLYWNGLSFSVPFDAYTPAGIVDTSDAMKYPLKYRGIKRDIATIIGEFGWILNSAAIQADFVKGSDFNTTFEDIEGNIIMPKPDEDSVS